MQHVMLGECQTIVDARRRVVACARFGVNALVIGERGTGKSAVARVIHRESARVAAPFVVVHCSSSHDVEGELFGPTGAIAAARTGTLVVDDIGELPARAQRRLLRAIEADAAESARVIATSRTPALGSLYVDLRLRLTCIVELPPLRERRADIALLTRHFLDRFAARHGSKVLDVPPEVLTDLESYEWPGNVRELECVVERLAITAASDQPISLALVRAIVADVVAEGPSAQPQGLALREQERALVVRAFRESGGNLSQTARTLKVARSTLRDMLRRYAPELLATRPAPRDDARDRVLLVEDDASTRLLLRNALVRAGYEVVECATGKAALDAFDARDGDFDAVVCDLVLPHMDGDEVATALRRRNAKLPVVFISGYPFSRVSQLEGRGPFLQKPFPSAVLVSHLRSLISERH